MRHPKHKSRPGAKTVAELIAQFHPSADLTVYPVSHRKTRTARVEAEVSA